MIKIYHKVVVMAAVCLSLLPTTSFAQAVVAPIEGSSDAVTPSYVLASQDALTVTVMSFPDLTQQVVVLPDGTVTLPLLGSVNVSGKSTAQVERDLTTLYSKYVVNPVVSVAVTNKHPQFVTFSGFIARPGPFDYRPDLHIIEAIAESGGALANGDLSKVTVTTLNGDTQELDLSRPETKAGTSLDIILNQNDVVYVPESHDEFSVVGEVARPGSYTFVQNMSVLDALTAVGQPLDSADLKSASLLHNGVETHVDLYALIHQGDMSQNLLLSPGDRLTVPAGMRTYVYGAVNKPGFYPLTPGDRILDALNAAGGPAGQFIGGGPDTAKIRLIRIDKTKTHAVVQIVDLQKFFNTGDVSKNVVLQPGDVLYIPTKGKKFSLQDSFAALQGLNLLNEGASIAQHGLGN